MTRTWSKPTPGWPHRRRPRRGGRSAATARRRSAAVRRRRRAAPSAASARAYNCGVSRLRRRRALGCACAQSWLPSMPFCFSRMPGDRGISITARARRVGGVGGEQQAAVAAVLVAQLVLDSAAPPTFGRWPTSSRPTGRPRRTAARRSRRAYRSCGYASQCSPARRSAPTDRGPQTRGRGRSSRAACARARASAACSPFQNATTLTTTAPPRRIHVAVADAIKQHVVLSRAEASPSKRSSTSASYGGFPSMPARRPRRHGEEEVARVGDVPRVVDGPSRRTRSATRPPAAPPGCARRRRRRPLPDQKRWRGAGADADAQRAAGRAPRLRHHEPPRLHRRRVPRDERRHGRRAKLSRRRR